MAARPRASHISNSLRSARATTTAGTVTNVAAAAIAAASTVPRAAPPAYRESVTDTSAISAKAPANDAVSLAAQREPLSRPPDQPPWLVLLLAPLLVCALTLGVTRRRTFKEKSNARIRS